MINTELLTENCKELGISLNDFACERFDSYAERLVRWNKHVNITSITEPEDIVTKHFTDSLAVLKYVQIPDGASLVDVGTGAGFPGLPLLIAKPDIDVTFVDSVGKKLAFIKEVARLNGLVCDIVHTRAEELGRDADYRERFDFATARAVAPLNMLCEYCLPLVKVRGRFVSLKGANGAEELKEAENAIKTLGGELESSNAFTLPNGDKRFIFVIKKISQTPTKYPRRSKKIDTKPL